VLSVGIFLFRLAPEDGHPTKMLCLMAVPDGPIPTRSGFFVIMQQLPRLVGIGFIATIAFVR
jgi:hypothetical protein